MVENTVIVVGPVVRDAKWDTMRDAMLVLDAEAALMRHRLAKIEKARDALQQVMDEEESSNSSEPEPVVLEELGKCQISTRRGSIHSGT